MGYDVVLALYMGGLLGSTKRRTIIVRMRHLLALFSMQPPAVRTPTAEQDLSFSPPPIKQAMIWYSKKFRREVFVTFNLNYVKYNTTQIIFIFNTRWGFFLLYFFIQRLELILKDIIIFF